MKTDVIVGIVYSKYDEIIGPDAFYWLPGDLSKDILRAVSGKTLNMLAGDETAVVKEMEIVSFPTIDLKGLIKFMHIIDPTKRGGFVNATITLLFSDKDATIFYKYRADFQTSFDPFSLKIAALEKQKANAKEFLQTFNDFSDELTRLIKDLFEKEVGLKDQSEFPDTEEDQAVKYRTYKFKVVVVGDPEVGKSSVILRYTDNAFRRTYIVTMGVNVTSKTMIYNDRKVKFAIWDIAGQSKFQLTRHHFYEGAQGIILVFDLTRPETFENIEKWYLDIKKTVKSEVPGVIFGNKADLVKEGKITSERIEEIAQRLGLGYIETSALDGKNVNEAFMYLAAMLVNKGKETPIDE
nr:Rab family GTPase [Candidatus Sigynarchaeota archaeon]